MRAVLRDLIEIGEARYRGFDWQAFDGSRRKDETLLRAKPTIILEGVYSGRVGLRHLVDVLVLVTVSEPERVRRLVEREGEISAWEAQWHRAED